MNGLGVYGAADYSVAPFLYNARYTQTSNPKPFGFIAGRVHWLLGVHKKKGGR
jgi:hypothetical protein